MNEANSHLARMQLARQHLARRFGGQKWPSGTPMAETAELQLCMVEFAADAAKLKTTPPTPGHAPGKTT